MTERRRGELFGVAAYLMWGLVPLYWRELGRAGPIEVLAHRIIWSLLVVSGILWMREGFGWLRTLGKRRTGLLSLAALIIAINWGTYIYGVQQGLVVETSLGYFINPLLTVVFGVVLLKERLRRAQWVAVGIAAIAIAVLTVDYGRPPWIAFTLALTFGTYGLLKKQAGVDAVKSLAVESAVLWVPALFFLVALQARGSGSFVTGGGSHTALLVASGLVSAFPLLCFGAAAIRVPLTTLGLLQYLAPVMQFLLGVFIFREDMPASRWIGFVLIWIALLVLTVDGVRTARRRFLARAAELT